VAVALLQTTSAIRFAIVGVMAAQFTWEPSLLAASSSVHSFKIWSDAGRPLGASLLWELKYLLSYARFVSDPWNWFRQNDTSGRFCKLLRAADLADDNIWRGRTRCNSIPPRTPSEAPRCSALEEHPSV
jgi:hypothetical protein